MATATVINTSEPSFSPQQYISSSQGNGVVPTTDPSFTGHVSPGAVYRMRAWDTVANQYVHWTSYGDPLTPPTTLNPVVGITAFQMSRPRTV